MPRRKLPLEKPPGKTGKPASAARSRRANNTLTNSDRVAEVIQQHEAQFEQRIAKLVAQLYQERVTAEKHMQQLNQRQQEFEQAQRDHEQFRRDAAVLRALLQASQNALLHAQPLTPARQRAIDAVLLASAPDSTAGNLAA